MLAKLSLPSIRRSYATFSLVTLAALLVVSLILVRTAHAASSSVAAKAACASVWGNEAVRTSLTKGGTESNTDTTSTKKTNSETPPADFDQQDFSILCENAYDHPEDGECKGITANLTLDSGTFTVSNFTAKSDSSLSTSKQLACGYGYGLQTNQTKLCESAWDEGMKVKKEDFVVKCVADPTSLKDEKVDLAWKASECTRMSDDGEVEKGVQAPGKSLCGGSDDKTGADKTLSDVDLPKGEVEKKGQSCASSDAEDSYVDNSGGTQPIRVSKTKVENAPSIVLVHGGGWLSDGNQYDKDFQKRAAAAGFTTFRIKYRLMFGGVMEQRADVMCAVKHVKENAKKYGIDPKRIAMLGDSAGSSLVIRSAVSGKSGAAAVVGWSGPTNAFRDLATSPEAWLVMLYHSRCFGEYIPAWANDMAGVVGNSTSAINRIAKGEAISPAESQKLLDTALKGAGLVMTDLPDTTGRLKKAAKDFGFTVNSPALDQLEKLGSTTSGDKKTDDTTATDDKTKDTTKTDDAKADDKKDSDDTKKDNTTKEGEEDTEDTRSEEEKAANLTDKLEKMDDKQSAELAASVLAFDQSTPPTSGMTEEEIARYGVVKGALDQLVQAKSTVDAEKAATGETTTDSTTKEGATPAENKEGTDGVISGKNENGTTITFNPQTVSTEKIAQCIDDFIQMSPSLVASPRTPPGFFVSAAKERWVPQADTYQMRDKLRSMGIKSDALILPHLKKMGSWDGHMGYDKRAEKASFEWLGKLLKAKTEAQAEKEGKAKKAAEDAKKTKETAAKDAENQNKGGTGDTGGTSGTPGTGDTETPGSGVFDVTDIEGDDARVKACNRNFGAYNWHWTEDRKGCVAGVGDNERANCYGSFAKGGYLDETTSPPKCKENTLTCDGNGFGGCKIVNNKAVCNDGYSPSVASGDAWRCVPDDPTSGQGKTAYIGQIPESDCNTEYVSGRIRSKTIHKTWWGTTSVQNQPGQGGSSQVSVCYYSYSD